MSLRRFLYQEIANYYDRSGKDGKIMLLSPQFNRDWLHTSRVR